MTIVQSKPNERIDIKLDFIEPFQDTSDVGFTFKEEGMQTVVTWNMHGRHTLVSKAMCLVMNMEKMIGAEYDKGLASMKAVVEAGKKK